MGPPLLWASNILERAAGDDYLFHLSRRSGWPWRRDFDASHQWKASRRCQREGVEHSFSLPLFCTRGHLALGPRRHIVQWDLAPLWILTRRWHNFLDWGVCASVWSGPFKNTALTIHAISYSIDDMYAGSFVLVYYLVGLKALKYFIFYLSFIIMLSSNNPCYRCDASCAWGWILDLKNSSFLWLDLYPLIHAPFLLQDALDQATKIFHRCTVLYICFSKVWGLHFYGTTCVFETKSNMHFN